MTLKELLAKNKKAREDRASQNQKVEEKKVEGKEVNDLQQETITVVNDTDEIFDYIPDNNVKEEKKIKDTRDKKGKKPKNRHFLVVEPETK